MMGSLPHDTNGASSPAKKISVAIIGGGVGGLCLALGLLQHSHLDVHVYEKAPTYALIGVGLQLPRNARRAIELLAPATKKAMDKHITGNLGPKHSNVALEYIVGTGEKEGTLICSQTEPDGMRSVHRAHFLGELIKEVPAECVHFNKRLLDLEETEEDTVTLHFDDGTSVTADVAIGVDGIHSKVRQIMMGVELATPVFAGTVVHRGTVPMEKASEALGAKHAHNATLLCGPDKNIITFPIECGKTLYITAVEYDHEEWPHEHWVLPTDHKQLTASFKDWGKAAQDTIKLLDLTPLRTWACFDSRPAPFFAKGRIAIMGDAAHAAVPMQAQGAAQALEDACVLTALFEQVRSPAHVPNALLAYDQTRRVRAQRVVSTAREAGTLASMRQRGVGGDLDKMKKALENRMHWIWHRDLVAQNEEAVRLFGEGL